MRHEYNYVRSNGRSLKLCRVRKQNVSARWVLLLMPSLECIPKFSFHFADKELISSFPPCTTYTQMESAHRLDEREYQWRPPGYDEDSPSIGTVKFSRVFYSQ